MLTSVHRRRRSAVHDADSLPLKSAGDASPDLVAVIPQLRRYARVLTGNPMRADDLVAATLVRARVERSPRHAGTDPRLGLFTIMHEVYVTGRAATVREAANISIAAEATRGSDAQCVEHKSPLARSQLREVEQRLGRLPAGEREVLLLAAVERLRYEEIAAILAIPVETVLSRLSRARDRLTCMAVERPPTLEVRRGRMEIEAAS
jgi:RNA polymerase sigma-70 factor (ECF subfamily)